MSLYTNAASAQRQLILSRVSSLRFEPSNDKTSPSNQKASTASRNLFSPLQRRADSSANIPVKDGTQSVSTMSDKSEQMTPTSIEGVTAKMTSTHLYPAKTTNTPTTFPEPGKFIGRLGTRTPAKITIDRRCKETIFSAKHSLDCSDISAILQEKKKRRTGIFNVSDGWVLFSCSTPDKENNIRSLSSNTRHSYSTAKRTSRKEKQGSLGDVYDFQLNRLAMKPCDRDKYSPSNEAKEDEDDKSSRSDLYFFSPIKCNLKDDQNEEQVDEEFANSNRVDDEALLTPTEINFDDDDQDILSMKRKTANEEDTEKVSFVDDNDGIFDDEEAPFAAFARDYFNN